jgi:Trypsin-like serine proteases, typically periplasmic, contain C-terminal PDZ domain
MNIKINLIIIRYERGIRMIPDDLNNHSNSFSYIEASVDDLKSNKEKPKGRVKKFFAIVLSAALFGSVAGGAFHAITVLGEYVLVQNSIVLDTETISTPIIEQVEAQLDINNINGSSVMVGDVSGIVETVMPSVVAINGITIQEYNTFFGQGQRYEVPSSGSGIIVGQNETELLIATNNHVVANTNTLEVAFIDESIVSAAIKGTDSESDLAVIAVKLSDISSETMNQIKVAKLGDSDEIKVGQPVIAIGNALGYGQSVTVGYISAKDRLVKVGENSRMLLQTDAAINPGNSGGALLNLAGEVVGINAAKYADTSVEGMGYAIPISFAEEILDDLMTKTTRIEIEETRRGYIGIRGANIDESALNDLGIPSGAYVYQIIEGSPAEESGIKPKDVIVKFDGNKIAAWGDLLDILTYYEAGSIVDVEVKRLNEGEYEDITLSLTLRPHNEIAD